MSMHLITSVCCCELFKFVKFPDFLNHSNLGIFLTNAVTYHMQLLHKMFPCDVQLITCLQEKHSEFCIVRYVHGWKTFQSVLNMTNFEFQNCFLLFLIILIISMFGTFLNLSSFLNYWTCCENVHCLILLKWVSSLKLSLFSSHMLPVSTFSTCFDIWQFTYHVLHHFGINNLSEVLCELLVSYLSQVTTICEELFEPVDVSCLCNSWLQQSASHNSVSSYIDTPEVQIAIQKLLSPALIPHRGDCFSHVLHERMSTIRGTLHQTVHICCMPQAVGSKSFGSVEHSSCASPRVAIACRFSETPCVVILGAWSWCLISHQSILSCHHLHSCSVQHHHTHGREAPDLRSELVSGRRDWSNWNLTVDVGRVNWSWHWSHEHREWHWSQRQSLSATSPAWSVAGECETGVNNFQKLKRKSKHGQFKKNRSFKWSTYSQDQNFLSQILRTKIVKMITPISKCV